jgi:carbon storage regulator
MFVLNGRPGQRIRIGDDIVVTVVRAERGNVRLAFECPASVRVIRDDLHPARVQEMEASAEPEPEDVLTWSRLRERGRRS